MIEKISDAFANIHRVVKTDEDLEWNRAVWRCTKIVQEVAKDGGWIPCSERLPEENVAVLVSTNDGAIGVDYYGAFCRDFIGLKGTYQKAIAWQPLPAPYQKGE